MSSTVPDDQERYRRARRRVREIRAFYIHLAVFVAVNLLRLWRLLGILAAARLGHRSPGAQPCDLSLDAVRWQGVGGTQDPGIHGQGST